MVHYRKVYFINRIRYIGQVFAAVWKYFPCFPLFCTSILRAHVLLAHLRGKKRSKVSRGYFEVTQNIHIETLANCHSIYFICATLSAEYLGLESQFCLVPSHKVARRHILGNV